MNRLLADTLAILNGILAVGIVLAGALAGYYGAAASGGGVFGGIVGAGLGFLVAGAICGLIAFLVLIEGHLRQIAEGRRADANGRGARTEPNL